MVRWRLSRLSIRRFFKVELAEGVSEVQIEGPVEIFEIVPKFD